MPDREQKARADRLRALAQAGDAEAQYNLGVCYSQALGVRKSSRQAIAWWRRAARQGFPLACHNLASRYLSGDGVKQDAAEALRLFRVAAEAGVAAAQCNLGLCLMDGRAGSRDQEEGLRWLRKAAAQQLAPAVEAVNQFERHGALEIVPGGARAPHERLALVAFQEDDRGPHGYHGMFQFVDLDPFVQLTPVFDAVAEQLLHLAKASCGVERMRFVVGVYGIGFDEKERLREIKWEADRMRDRYPQLNAILPEMSYNARNALLVNFIDNAGIPFDEHFAQPEALRGQDDQRYLPFTTFEDPRTHASYEECLRRENPTDRLLARSISREVIEAAMQQMRANRRVRLPPREGATDV